jgi:hypothetical protein
MNSAEAEPTIFHRGGRGSKTFCNIHQIEAWSLTFQKMHVDIATACGELRKWVVSMVTKSIFRTSLNYTLNHITFDVIDLGIQMIAQMKGMDKAYIFMKQIMQIS